MSQAQALYHLQEIELAILHGQKRMSEITTALADNAVVKSAQEQVTAAQTSLKPLQVKMRNLELEIQSNLQKSKATEQRMYSGDVRNPKELQDMQQEIEALKHWQGELENRLLDTMVAVEEAEGRLAEKQAELERATAQWETQHRDLLQEKELIEQRMIEQRAQHTAALTQVTPESLKVYTSLKPRKNNQPMAALQGSSCAVCGIEQTSAIDQEVRRGHQLVACIGCGRILVHFNL